MSAALQGKKVPYKDSVRKLLTGANTHALFAGVCIIKTDRADPPLQRNDSRATVRKVGYG
jgi:hypothetical protein